MVAFCRTGARGRVFLRVLQMTLTLPIFMLIGVVPEGASLVMLGKGEGRGIYEK